MSSLLQWIATVIVLVGVTLSVICKQNSKAKYFIKLGMLAGIYMLTATLVVPFALFRPYDAYNMGWWKFWVQILQTSWLFGLDIKTINAAELDYEGPCVVVCNHQTAIDQIAVLQVWPRGRGTFMAKKSLKYAGPMGVALILAGAIFVDRKNKEMSKIETTRECIKLITEKGSKLWVYPEGTRTGNRKEAMLPFKKGAFHIAVQTQVPIIPVVISGHKDMFSDRNHKFDNVQITVTVLPKIPTNGLTADDVTSFSERVRLMMLGTYYNTSPHINRPVTIETEDNLETLSGDATNDNKTNSSESCAGVEILKTKTGESDTSVHLEDTFNKLEGAQGQNANYHNTQIADCEPAVLAENTQTEIYDRECIVKGSNNPSSNVDATDSSVLCESTVLVSLRDKNTQNTEICFETKPNNENEDSLSSQASSDSFVFVDSSKLDNKAHPSTLNDTLSSLVTNVSKGVVPEELKITEIM